jgi:hypothetical protein
LEATESASGRLIRSRYAVVLGVGFQNRLSISLSLQHRPSGGDNAN